MEENPKPRSSAFLVACLLHSLISGCVGGVLGATMGIHGGIFNLPEAYVPYYFTVGPTLGLAVGTTVWMLQPRRDVWQGCLGWAVLLTGVIAGSALLSGLVFYVMVRIQRG